MKTGKLNVQGTLTNTQLDVLMDNLMLNAFRTAVQGSLTIQKMEDSLVDEYEDQSGIDTEASTGEVYNSSDDYYSPYQTAALEIDYMEYSSDGAAQAAYVSNSETKLLMHCNKVDGSKSHTITCHGTAQLDTAQQEFGTASLLLDGNSDYLTIPDSNDWYFGTGDFTIDCWFRLPVLPGGSTEYTLASQYINNDNQWQIVITTDKKIEIYFAVGGVTKGSYRTTSALAISVDTWYHLAVVRNGTTALVFLDGVSQTMKENTAFGTNDVGNLAANLFIGKKDYTVPAYFNGWLDEIRISKGIARWTTGFTPPTAKHISDQYTALLLHCDGTDTSTTIPDVSGGDEGSVDGKVVTYVGTAQIDTAEKKFGGASLLLDGNSDYVSIPDSDDWYFGANDFTIDFWMRFNSVTGERAVLGHGTHPATRMYLRKLSSGELIWYESVAEVTLTSSGVTFTTGQWYHVAVVRNGTSFVMYIDGIQRASTTSSASLTNKSGEFWIGYDPTADNKFDGWIDEFRISKGVARWTSDFTPPTSDYSMGCLLSYSESTIKSQGSYSLKVVAAITGSLNKTLTKTFGSPKDFSGINSLSFDVYASRTGSNLKFGIHDTEGTTTELTPNITVANSWQTVTWDLSEVSDANKNAIDTFIVTVVNADAANTFYLDNFIASAVKLDMSLQSTVQVAETTPTTARIILFEEDVDSITINTDLKAWVSRDGGTTWSQITLTDEGAYDSTKLILAGNVDVSGQPSGTNMKYKVTTHNEKNLKLHGTALSWRA